MQKWIHTLLVCLTFALPALAADEAASPAPQPGQPAPAFRLQDQGGAWRTLEQYRGQWVVLYFYPKDMTPGCTIEARNFQRDQAAYAARGATVLGVSVDDVNSHKQFCTKESLQFHLLADTDKKVSDAYGSLNNFLVVKLAARHTFVIDPKGKIARVFGDVKPSTHSQEVLAALDSLGARPRP